MLISESRLKQIIMEEYETFQRRQLTKSINETVEVTPDYLKRIIMEEYQNAQREMLSESRQSPRVQKLNQNDLRRFIMQEARKL